MGVFSLRVVFLSPSSSSHLGFFFFFCPGEIGEEIQGKDLGEDGGERTEGAVFR